MPALGAESVAGTFIFDRERLQRLGSELGEAYRSARPFPHIVIDDFLPAAVLDEVLAEFPPNEDPRWWTFDTPRERKLSGHDPAMLGPVTRHVLEQLNTGVMIDFLEDLTGIKGLVPDPHFIGGGVHQVQRGGHLDLHADFSRHPLTGLERRLNLLVYLNRQWCEDYGGELELWERNLASCGERILPVFNRCVVFNTSQTSFHGHPAPLRCPEGMSRRSLALYYFSREPPPEDGQADPLWYTHFPTDRRGLRVPVLKRWVRRVLPPIVVDAAKTARRRAGEVRDRRSR